MSDNLEMRKYIIWVLVVLIVVAFIAVAILIQMFTKKESANYLVVKDYLILNKEDNGWKQITEFNNNVLNQVYTIYNDEKTIKNAKMQINNDSVYFFDNNYKEIQVPDYRVATSGINISLAYYNNELASEKDQSYINTILNQMEVKNDSLYRTYKYEVDFDNDNELETLYLTTNYSFDDVDYDINSYLYMVDNGKITQIIDSIKDKKLDVIEILDIDEDETDELIIAKGVINIPKLDSCYQIYKIEKGTWKLIKDCQA